jgi:hypothetical protein
MTEVESLENDDEQIELLLPGENQTKSDINNKNRKEQEQQLLKQQSTSPDEQQQQIATILHPIKKGKTAKKPNTI